MVFRGFLPQSLEGREANDVFKVIWTIFAGERHFKSLTEEKCGTCVDSICKYS